MLFRSLYCYCEKIPASCFARLGIRQEGKEPTRFHSPTFVFDEEALPVGAGFFVQAMLELNGTIAGPTL